MRSVWMYLISNPSETIFWTALRISKRRFRSCCSHLRNWARWVSNSRCTRCRAVTSRTPSLTHTTQSTPYIKGLFFSSLSFFASNVFLIYLLYSVFGVLNFCYLHCLKFAMNSKAFIQLPTTPLRYLSNCEIDKLKGDLLTQVTNQRDFLAVMLQSHQVHHLMHLIGLHVINRCYYLNQEAFDWLEHLEENQDERRLLEPFVNGLDEAVIKFLNDAGKADLVSKVGFDGFELVFHFIHAPQLFFLGVV